MCFLEKQWSTAGTLLEKVTNIRGYQLIVNPKKNFKNIQVTHLIVLGTKITFPKLNAHRQEKLLTQSIVDGYELYILHMHDYHRTVIIYLKSLC